MNKLIKILLVLNTSLFVISLSILLVLLCRPFYYIHIDYLDLEKESGYSYNEIKEAYDDVIDYLTLNKEFKTGKLKYSPDGYNHFRDCKILFFMDFIVLGISSFIIILKKRFFNNITIKNHSTGFISGISIIIFFSSIFILSLIIGFKKLFDGFHEIFFLGKSNWLLDPVTDEIIDILPREFFMHCAILVLLIIFVISIVMIIKDLLNKKVVE